MAEASKHETLGEPGWRREAFSGWGRLGTAQMLAARPERASELAGILASAGAEGIIVHAGGCSYGDSALNAGGRAILTRRLDRLLAFDPANGLLVAEAGVRFEDLRRVLLPRGFLAPVTPGTAFATLGGAIAHDVHGKNQDRAGNFGAHVEWLDLVLPTGEVRRLTPADRLFRATVGGLGLTGVILALALRLMPVPSRFVAVRERPVADLDEFLGALEVERSRAAYSVGWIDAQARGRALGRGIVEAADPAPADAGDSYAEARGRRLPVDLPGFVLNPLSIAAFNALYWRRVPKEGRERRLAYDRFLYPLDAIADWNRLYGRRGFHQFQALLPEPGAIRVLLEACAASRAASFLAVLKTMGQQGAGLLSFGGRGHTLALDFPAGPGIDGLLGRLERLVLDHGGQVYLAKDSRLSAAGFAAMYPRLPEFREILAEIDPEGRMRSDLAVRLAIRRAA